MSGFDLGPYDADPAVPLPTLRYFTWHTSSSAGVASAGAKCECGWRIEKPSDFDAEGALKRHRLVCPSR